MFEPQRSDYDLKFTIMDIPVRVHPFFWLLCLVLGFNVGGQGPQLPVMIILVTIAVFVSVLAHELGHALTGRIFGSSRVSIVLHGFGGAAIGASGKTKMQQIQVIAAGPGMGLLLSLPFLFTMIKSNRVPSWMTKWPWLTEQMGKLVEHSGGFITINNDYLSAFISIMVFINVGWSILNLIPVYPLDGGQIMKEIIDDGRTMFGPSVLVNKISIVLAVVVGVLAITQRQPFLAILFGIMAYQNYQMMNRSNYY